MNYIGQFHDIYMLKFQIQPDLDELPVNMEDNEDAESTKSEVKLGKLQFSLDYDFQKGEVKLIFNFDFFDLIYVLCFTMSIFSYD